MRSQWSDHWASDASELIMFKKGGCMGYKVRNINNFQSDFNASEAAGTLLVLLYAGKVLRFNK